MWFRSLDSWRGPAALAVILFHFSGAYYPVDFGRFVRDSYLFVDFFFVLSGLVIATAYGERLKQPGEAARFVIRRFGRLWPLHMATLLGVLAWQLRKGGHPNLALFTDVGLNPLLSNGLMIHALGVNSTLAFNVPSWAVSAEFWTCLVFLVVARLGSRAAPLAAALLLASSAAVIFLFSDVGMDTTYAFGFPRAVYGFFTGYFVCLLLGRLGARGPGGTLAEAASLVLAVAFVVAAGYRESALSELSPLAFAPVVLVFAQDRGVLSAVLGLAPFRFLGRISYSIYLVHFPVLIVKNSALHIFLNRTGVDYTDETVIAATLTGNLWPLLTIVGCYFAIVIAAATLTFHLIEQPGRALANRIANARQGAPAVATP